jgi:hypothetical protein
MDDPDTWTTDTRADLGLAVEVFQHWREPLRTATITRPPVAPTNVDTVLATCADGRALLAVSSPPGVHQVELRPDLVGDYVITDEWTGEESARVTFQDDPWLIDVDPNGAGLILSLSPNPSAGDHSIA